MSSTAITGIAELVTNDPRTGDGTRLGILRDAAVVVDGSAIAWVGAAAAVPATDERVDVGGRAVVPGFVDTHTHLVFAGDRAAEFASRMAELRSQGTTTTEIKSGYGLTVVDEERLLRLARECTDETTFLGAHVVPPGAQRAAYIELVTGEMLTACAPEARWIDVFCEPASPHAFDGDEARTVLEAGRDAGLGLRVHGNQLSAGPGVRLAVELGAASVDHCTFLVPADIDALASGSTVATLLPGVEFSSRSRYPAARVLLDAGVTVALATDCNPGTSYTSSMPFVIALAVRELSMTPAEALWAATAGGAAALRRHDVGVIAPGARGDLAVLDAPSFVHLAYRPGVPIASALTL